VNNFYESINKRYEKANNRGNWERQWSRIARLISPQSDFFQTKYRTSGQRNAQELFDSTAQIALERSAAAMESYITPSTKQWMTLQAMDRRVAKSPKVKMYLEEVTQILFQYRYSPDANFQSQMNEVYKSLCMLGSATLMIGAHEDRPGFYYRAVPLSETYYLDNHMGIVDTIFRRLKLTVRQAIQKFGEKALEGLAKKIKEDPEYELMFVQAYMPMKDIPASEQISGYDFVCVTICDEMKDIIEKTGYYTRPMIAGRYATFPGDVYGYGPGSICLNSNNILQQMKKTMLKAGQRAVDPVMLTVDDGSLSVFNMTPGFLNPGGLNELGQPLVVPLESRSNFQIGLDMMQDEQKSINDAFLITLFDVLAQDQPQMTATEVLARTAEKGALYGPVGGRVQTEIIGPSTIRELDILKRQNQLPPMPQELIDVGGLAKVVYTSPLNQAQKASRGQDIIHWVEALVQMASVSPEAVAKVDFPAVAGELADILDISPRLIVSDELLAERKQQQEQAMQLEQASKALPGLASVGKTFVDAQNQGSPVDLSGLGIPPTAPAVGPLG
jgi:hypothetical protein